MKTIQVTYRIHDGYVSGGRKFSFALNAEEFKDCTSDEEMLIFLECAMQSDFDEKVYPYLPDKDEVIEKIKNALQPTS